ncbi:hypothetical protein ACLOJK_034057 [Asimina triloba]
MGLRSADIQPLTRGYFGRIRLPSTTLPLSSGFFFALFFSESMWGMGKIKPALGRKQEAADERKRSGQERKSVFGGDYSMQAQAEGLMEQPQLLFSNAFGSPIPASKPFDSNQPGVAFFSAEAGGIPRKRAREAVAAAAETPVDLFSLQPAVVNLAQLHNQQQPAMVSTGLRLAPEAQQQQMQTNLLLPSSFLSSFLDDFSPHIKLHRDEIDQFLKAQGEQLRRTLAEKRASHYRALLSAAEESAARRLREKDAELSKASLRKAELEERAAQLRAEAHVWEARARAQEAAAATLQAQLQQAIILSGQAQDRREEAALACAGGEAEDAESAHVDPARLGQHAPPCRACRRRAASVVVLPCRHLCVCSECVSTMEACPICQSVRSASVEVFLS